MYNLREYLSVTEEHSKFLQEDLREAEKIIGGFLKGRHYLVTIDTLYITASLRADNNSLRADNRQLRRRLFESNSKLDKLKDDYRFKALEMELREDEYGGSVSGRLNAGKHLACLSKGNNVTQVLL